MVLFMERGTQMKDSFNQLHVEEMLKRIHQLSPNSKPQWDKMDVTQMLSHCSSFQDIAMGNAFPSRGLVRGTNREICETHFL